MATIVKLQTGDSIATDEDPQALADRFDAARDHGTLVKVDSAAGSIWINPHALATISPHDLTASQVRSRHFSEDS